MTNADAIEILKIIQLIAGSQKERDALEMAIKALNGANEASLVVPYRDC